MGLSAPAARAAAGTLLLLLILVPPSAGQAPPLPSGDPQSSAMALVVVCGRPFVSVAYAGTADAECYVQDLGRDSVYAPGSTSGTSVSNHMVNLHVEGVDPTSGWQVLVSPPFIPLYGGDVVPFNVNVKATPLIQTHNLSFTLVAEYTVQSSGYNATYRIPFAAEVRRYDFALVRVTSDTLTQKAGQDDVVTYTIEVENAGVYPDVYRFSVKTDADIRVSVPGTLYVPPGEKRTVNVSLLTPHGKLYELGRSLSVNIKVESVTGTGVYSTVGILQIRGAYVPVYWIPLSLVGLVAGAVVVGKARERGELRRLEKGRPRRVQPTPRQAVLLAELKRTDPEAHKERQAQLAAVYAARRETYKDAHREQVKADKEERRHAKAEFKEAKRRRKAERKEEKARLSVERKESKRAAKAERKELKARGKELKKKQKLLAKARKKQAKVDAKLAAKEAKAQAKAEKAASREARKAAKASKRAAKKSKGDKP